MSDERQQETGREQHWRTSSPPTSPSLSMEWILRARPSSSNLTVAQRGTVRRANLRERVHAKRQARCVGQRGLGSRRSGLLTCAGLSAAFAIT
jgi:hypothetical protein